METELLQKKCQPAAAKLSPERLAELHAQVPQWKIESGELRRTFSFKNYYQTLAFVNATAWISHREDHHPDMEVGYNKVIMRYATHSAGGLTENDFICAAKVDQLGASA